MNHAPSDTNHSTRRHGGTMKLHTRLSLIKYALSPKTDIRINYHQNTNHPAYKTTKKQPNQDTTNLHADINAILDSATTLRAITQAAITYRTELIQAGCSQEIADVSATNIAEQAAHYLDWR